MPVIVSTKCLYKIYVYTDLVLGYNNILLCFYLCHVRIKYITSPGYFEITTWRDWITMYRCAYINKIMMRYSQIMLD